MRYLVLFALLASPAQALCGYRADVVSSLAWKYGEARQGAKLPRSVMPIEIYANPVTRTWTIIENRIGGRACVVATGRGFPIVKGSNT